MTDANRDIEPPSEDLRALFAQEVDISSVERAAIRSKLAVTIGKPGAATILVGSSKPLWIAAAAIAAVAGIWWATRGEATPALEPMPRSSVEAVAPPAPPPAADTPQQIPEAAVVTPEHDAHVDAEPPRRRETPKQPAPSQAELLAKAWRALANDPTETLRLLDLDQRLHARGALVEERDALRVQTLTALDRREEAGELAARFIERYPRSVHRKAVERALVEAP